MSNTIITAHVIDQSIQLANLPKLASGSENVVQIRFDFCDLWAGYGKTAVFYKTEELIYHVALVDNVATVPSELLATAGSFSFSVLGVAENTRTTEVRTLDVEQGTPTTGLPAPTPDIYEQILAAVGAVQASAAPAGYGWGENFARMPDGNDVNNAWATGLYRTDLSTISNKPADDCFLVFTKAATRDYVIQTAYCHNGCMLRRTGDNKEGTWDTWLWVNPPMVLGQFYATTERYNGNVVMTAAYEVTLSSETTEQFALPATVLPSNKNIIGIEGAVIDSANSTYFPVSLNVGGDQYCTAYVAGGKLCVEHTSIVTGCTLRVVLKFI